MKAFLFYDSLRSSLPTSPFVRSLLLTNTFLQAECKIMRSWTYPKIVRLAGCLVKRRFLAGDAICKQGEESHVMYLLRKGKVSIQKEVTYIDENRWPNQEGDYTVLTHERTVALHLCDLKVGDHFGEEIALGHATRQYSAIATESTDCFAVNKSDILKFFKGNQIAAELMNNVSALYESPKAVKERHDSEVRRAALYNNIKKLAFGDKYKGRTGLNKPKKIKRTKETSPLELSLRRLNRQNREREVRGQNVDEDAFEAKTIETTSLADSVPSITNQKLNPRRLPVLRKSIKKRREVRERVYGTSMSIAGFFSCVTLLLLTPCHLTPRYARYYRFLVEDERREVEEPEDEHVAPIPARKRHRKGEEAAQAQEAGQRQ